MPRSRRRCAGGGASAAIAGAFGWADFVGSLLAQIFRGAFILNFVFGALAVACAAISIVRHDWKPVLVVIEILLIVAVVLNTGLGRRRQWHRRWFEGRELAERLRVALLLWVVGLRPVAAAGAEPTWTGWYARAVVRAQGLRHGRLDGDGLAAARAAVTGLLNDQCGYHEATGQTHAPARAPAGTGGARLLRADHRGGARLSGGQAARARRPRRRRHGGHGESLADRFRGHRRGTDRRPAGARDGHLRHPRHRRFCRHQPALGAHPCRPGRRSAGGSRRRTPTCTTSGRGCAPLPTSMLGDVAGWRLSAESRGLAIPG